ncbi:MAG: helix-turn-helix transcriptional regulator [Rubrivivax sp.]|nr:helix-turn-helix transcriptional regulator [Rubrivivax sp.]
MQRTTFGQRLQTALDTSNRKPAELARVLRSPKGSLGVSTSAVAQVINGASRSLTAENCLRAARFLGVSPYWLATGEGAMLESTPMLQEPAPRWIATRDVLERMGLLLNATPAALRPGLADLLAAWVHSGGDPDRMDAIARLLDAAPAGASEKPRAAA